jgi:hypothetical protein
MARNVVSRHSGNRDVLVVADRREAGELIEKTLRRYGYTVIAHSGPIHAPLTDVVLPSTKRPGRRAATPSFRSRFLEEPWWRVRELLASSFQYTSLTVGI